MSFTLWLLILLGIFAALAIVLSACWASRPSDWERQLEDEEQLEYLRRHQKARKLRYEGLSQ